jgi:predicted RNA-binding Zn ribbon-like protein
MTRISQKKQARRRPPKFDLSAGAVCLDFVNTLDDRFKTEPKELLKDYLDFARFAEDTGILAPHAVDRLFALSQTSPAQAQRALTAAIQMREAIYQVFWARVNAKEVPAAALITLNQYLQVAAQHSKLVPANGHFEWRFEDAPNNLESPLWPIARSAGELLASEHLEFVRACASQACQWLFLDSSKNHRRRWCDMKQCGNREKVRRFYEHNRP